MRAVVIAGGEPGDDAFVRAQCAGAFLLIAADGGGRVCLRLGLRPTLALGDWDTAGAETVAELRAWGVPVEAFPAEKDYTDTYLALTVAIARGATDITVLGALGGPRYDHMLATVLSLSHATFAGIVITLVDPLHRVRVLRGGESVTLVGVAGEYVSLLALTDTVTDVSGSGLRYPLPPVFTRGDNLGVSNELTQPTAQVAVGGGVLLVIHTRTRNPDVPCNE